MDREERLNKRERMFAAIDTESKESLPARQTNKKYHRAKRTIIHVIYVVFFILWICIALWLGLYVSGIVGAFIALVPLVLFTISTVSIPYLTMGVEEQLFKANFLSLGLVVVIPLFGLMSKNYKGDQRQFLYVLLMAIVFAIVSLMDIWLSPNYMSVVKHIKSSLQIFAIVLLVFGIWLYGSRCGKHHI